VEIAALLECLSTPSCVFSQLANALVMAMVLFLVASGLSLILGVLGVVNFAHGSLYMLGAYFTYTLMIVTGNFGVSAILASIGVGILGVVVERVFIRRVYGAPLLFQLLLTYGFILVLDDAVKMIWGYQYHSIGLPETFRRPPWMIAGSVIPSYYVFTIVVGVVVAVALWLFLSRTRLGKIIVAAAHDVEMVSALGINVPLLFTAVFGIGAALAGLGGVMAGPVRSAFPGMGFSVVVESFIVVVIGGLGSVGGAFLGALLLGLFQSIGAVVFPNFEESLPFILMALVLIVRPQGLMGKAED
jgi:branched-chain amino acid transport system permease protein